MYALIQSQLNCFDAPSPVKVAVEDIHQIENGDIGGVLEGCLQITEKDLKTTYFTWQPIRFVE